MSLNQTTLFKIPADFRAQTTGFLLKQVELGRNVQFIGSIGSGKSLLLRTLAKNYPEKFIYLDLLVDSLPHSQLNISPDHPQALIIDDLDTLLNTPTPPINIFNWIYGIQNHYRDRLCVIAGTNMPTTDIESLEKIGRLGKLMSEVIYFLPPLSESDSNWFIRESARQSEKELSSKDIHQLHLDSGGHMQTLKRLTETFGDPEPNLRLSHHFHQFHQYISKFKFHPEYLQAMFLKDSSGNWTIPAFQKYLNTLPPESDVNPDELFTKNEAQALDILRSHANSLVTRDDLIKALWGDSADTSISDHALDQLIHRIKEKLRSSASKENIVTIRGRGHKLTSPL